MNLNEAVSALQKQGLKLHTSVDLQGARVHIKTADGEGYILRYSHLMILEREGRLDLSGIKALDQEIRHHHDRGQQSSARA